jgi:hypothetical protein
MAWLFTAAGDSASLIHGVPETDDADFIGACRRGSGMVNIVLPNQAAPGAGAPVPVVVTAGGFTKTFQGRGTPVSQVTGISEVTFDVPSIDPLWTAVARETALSIGAGASITMVSLSGSATPTRNFVQACSLPMVAPPPPPPVAGRQPPLVAPPPPPPPGAGGRGTVVVRYQCQNGPNLRITFNGAARTAVINETAAPPMVLVYDPGARGAERYTNGPARLVVQQGQVRWTRLGGPAFTCVAR